MEKGVEDVRRRRFEELFRETRADLLAYLLRRSGGAEEAADVLAETYLVAWRKLEAIPDGPQRRPWLFGVARNLLLKGASRRRTQGVLVERLAREVRAADPVHPHEDEEGRGELRAALAALPELDREIVTLSAWEGLTPREIAPVVGRSANAVRVRLHRARARLRAELGLAERSRRSGEDAIGSGVEAKEPIRGGCAS
jgi:RNA polymerase sigma-70 factor (ECF subfamily)